ncbi:MAG: ATP-dependent zinc metalloprotease FtsH [Lentisphaerae bacterium]|nr:ATP-dependent zinc metalloprotease FtsH [Lentisphaerota bacterium]
MVQLYRTQQSQANEISYSKFASLVTEGKVKSCKIVHEVSGTTYVDGEIVGESGAAEAFKVYVGRADEDLRALLLTNGVEFRVPPQNPYMWQLVSSVLPIVLIFGLLYFLFMRQIRSAGHGALSFGKSRAKQLNKEKSKVTFANVGGIDEAKEEVQEIIEFLKDPKKFTKLGGRIPKGVLLMGPPGTGKTLLAKAIAGEADVPFFSISGSDFVEMFVGVGASRVRDMFLQGKKNAPCIIFIDEIDAVGRSRFTGIGGGHDEREQTLNALLVEMDGFETEEGVIIVAATNRPDVLDPALLRPGRFDRQIVIDLPSIDGRDAILGMHSQGKKIAEGVAMRRIARGTPGFSGADLANLLNEAALLAAREGKEAVELSDLEEARDKVRWGRERRSRVLDAKERRITAYHEAGHALVMQMVEESEPLHKITIIPRGVAYLGATMQLPLKDSYMEGRTKLLGILCGFMGGRVAEKIVFGDITSGAASDLKESTRLAHLMICNWGMSEEMGPQTFGQNQELMFLGREVQRTQDYSEATAQRIDAEVSRLLGAAFARAEEILTTHREKLNMIAEMLLDQETVDGRDVEEIVEHNRVLSEEERDAIDVARGPDPADASVPQPEATDPTATASVVDDAVSEPKLSLSDEGDGNPKA